MLAVEDGALSTIAGKGEASEGSGFLLSTGLALKGVAELVSLAAEKDGGHGVKGEDMAPLEISIEVGSDDLLLCSFDPLGPLV